jgi:hypothetical protein
MSSLASVILVSGIVYQSTKARYIPFVVQVDRQGYALTLPEPLSPPSDPAIIDHMERYEIAAFMRLAAWSRSTRPACVRVRRDNVRGLVPDGSVHSSARDERLSGPHRALRDTRKELYFDGLARCGWHRIEIGPHAHAAELVYPWKGYLRQLEVLLGQRQ